MPAPHRAGPGDADRPSRQPAPRSRSPRDACRARPSRGGLLGEQPLDVGRRGAAGRARTARVVSAPPAARGRSRTESAACRCGGRAGRSRRRCRRAARSTGYGLLERRPQRRPQAHGRRDDSAWASRTMSVSIQVGMDRGDCRRRGGASSSRSALHIASTPALEAAVRRHRRRLGERGQRRRDGDVAARLAITAGSAARTVRNAPSEVDRDGAATHASGSVQRERARTSAIPAFAHTASSRPWRSSTVATARVARRRGRARRAADRRRRSPSMSASTGVQPREASSRAVAAPMPRAPPVISTTFMPSRRSRSAPAR